MQIYPLKALSWPVLTFHLSSIESPPDFTFRLVLIKIARLGRPSKRWPLEATPFCRRKRHSGLHATPSLLTGMGPRGKLIAAHNHASKMRSFRSLALSTWG